MNRYLVIPHSTVERRVLYLGTLIRIDFRRFARYPFEVSQDRQPFEHFLNGIGAQQVVVNKIQLMRIGSFVALGFSLIGIGWLYSRQLRASVPTAERGE